MLPQCQPASWPNPWFLASQLLAQTSFSPVASYWPKTRFLQQPSSHQNPRFLNSHLLNKIHFSSVARYWPSPVSSVACYWRKPIFLQSSYWPHPRFFNRQLLTKNLFSSVASCWPKFLYWKASYSPKSVFPQSFPSIASYFPKSMFLIDQLLFKSHQKHFFHSSQLLAKKKNLSSQFLTKIDASSVASSWPEPFFPQ